MKFFKVSIFSLLIFSFAFGTELGPLNSQNTGGAKDNKKLEAFKAKYLAKNVWTYRNGKEVRLSYYDILVEIDKKEFGERSLRLYNDVKEIFSDPLDTSKRHQYLDNFPERFHDFVEIFNPADFGELYPSNEVFLLLLEDSIHDNPEKGAALLVGLAKDAKYDADAPALLQRILSVFITDFYDFYIMEFNKLNEQAKLNAVDFLSDYENIDKNETYENVLNTLKEKNNRELLKKFFVAKEKRTAMGPHGERR